MGKTSPSTGRLGSGCREMRGCPSVGSLNSRAVEFRGECASRGGVGGIPRAIKTQPARLPDCGRSYLVLLIVLSALTGECSTAPWASLPHARAPAALQLPMRTRLRGGGKVEDGASLRGAEAAERRAEKAERRAAELVCQLEEMEEQYCHTEAALVHARAAAAKAASTAEKHVRAELDARIAALNERCNLAEAEVRWGNGERTRDLIIITELKHKVDEHERERGELEDKIRREFAADGVDCGSVEAARRAAPKDVVRAPRIPVELWPEHDKDAECEDACWCGAHGEEGGDVAGGGGWTGLEGDDEQEGPVALEHEGACAQVPHPGQAARDAARDEDDALTPLQLLDKLRKDECRARV